MAVFLKPVVKGFPDDHLIVHDHDVHFFIHDFSPLSLNAFILGARLTPAG